MINLEKYIGIPYKHLGRSWEGVDCIGLLYLVYRHEFNVVLPLTDEIGEEYNCVYEENLDQRFNNYLLSIGQFTKIPEHCDVLAFGGYDLCTHCGILLNDGVFIHAKRKEGKVIKSEMNQWYPTYLGAIKIYKGA